jgi:uncharacterized membrane protein
MSIFLSQPGSPLLGYEGERSAFLNLSEIKDNSMTFGASSRAIAIARFAYAHLRRFPIPIGGWMLCLILCGVGVGIATHYAVERPLLRSLGKR